MNARYKPTKSIVAVVLAFAMTSVLVWGILDEGTSLAKALALFSR